VYSVLEQAPGMERVFYLLEQKLLEPVYAIYPWAPDLTTSQVGPERAEFDQALFSRTSHTQVVLGQTPVRGVPNVSASVFPLSANTFPAKEAQVEAARERGLAKVKILWFFLVGIILLTAYFALWLLVRTAYVVAVHFVGLLALCLITLPEMLTQRQFAP